MKSIPGFDDVEVDNADLKGQEDAVEYIVLPSQSIERDTVDELVEEQRSRDAEVQPYESLGT